MHTHTRDSKFNVLVKWWINCLCKRSDSKHLKLFRPHYFCHNDSTLPLHQEDSHIRYTDEETQLYSNKNVLTKIGSMLGLTYRLYFADPCVSLYITDNCKCLFMWLTEISATEETKAK